MRLLALILLCLAMPIRVAAQDLISGLSQDQVEINSGYAGTSIVVFGAIEGADNASSTSKDIVVVVRGPETTMTVRQKAWVAGIWVNHNQATLDGMPTFYYLTSTPRPLAEIAPQQTLVRYQLGLKNITPHGGSAKNPAQLEAFRMAAIGERAKSGLYAQAEDVEFLSYSLFRARIPIPATAPRGEYTVEAYLFRDGTVASAQSTPLFVDQKGLERQLYRFALADPFVYGLATVAMALLLGWLSSLFIRQQR